MTGTCGAFLFLILGAFYPEAHADVRVSAAVDKNVAALNEQILLEVTVEGENLQISEPELPALPNFNLYSSGRNQKISIVNNQVSSSITFSYVLVPRFVGKSAIGPFSVESGGRRFSTQPIDVTITRPGAQAPPSAQSARPVPGAPSQQPPQPETPPGSAAPGAAPQPLGPDLFAAAGVDKKKVYVNEPLVLTVSFYTAVPLLGNAEYVPPATSGFLAEPLAPARPRRVRRAGPGWTRDYDVSEIQTILFPAQPGDIPIGSARIRCQVHQGIDFDPFSGVDLFRMFSQGFLGAQTKELATDPVFIRVEPLPEAGKPPGFTGAVGRYTLSAQADKTRLKTGDALNLTVVLEGQGNLKTLTAPKLPDLAPFRVYDTVSSLNVSKDQGVVRGSKAFKTVLVPKVSGRISIPAISYSAFDPSAKKYVELRTPPIGIDVEAGPPAETLQGFVAAHPSQPGTGITPVSEDIRHLKEKTGTGPFPTRALAFWASLGWLHLCPLLLLGGLAGAQRLKAWRTQDEAGTRFRTALGRARKRIAGALRELGTDPGRAAGGLSEALSGYLADKLNRSASALTLREALDLLRLRPAVRESSTKALEAAWQELELLRFAPSGRGTGGEEDDLAATAEGLDRLLKGLDREIR